MKSPSTVTNTRVCLENSIDLFDSQKSWGSELNKKMEQGLLEGMRTWALGGLGSSSIFAFY